MIAFGSLHSQSNLPFTRARLDAGVGINLTCIVIGALSLVQSHKSVPVSTCPVFKLCLVIADSVFVAIYINIIFLALALLLIFARIGYHCFLPTPEPHRHYIKVRNITDMAFR